MSACLSGEIKIESASRTCMEYHLSRCRGHLEVFDRETRAVTCNTKTQCAAEKIARIGQRIKLMPKKNALFEKLNTEFQHDVEAFRLCVDNVILYVSRRRRSDGDDTEHSSDTQQQIQSSIREVAKSGESMASSFSALLAMLGSIPKDAGYTWEGGEFKRHATLVLATGQEISIPPDLWNSFEVGSS